jgi:hypothetical protein
LFKVHDGHAITGGLLEATNSLNHCQNVFKSMKSLRNAAMLEMADPNDRATRFDVDNMSRDS